MLGREKIKIIDLGAVGHRQEGWLLIHQSGRVVLETADDGNRAYGASSYRELLPLESLHAHPVVRAIFGNL
jgi:hypothetical protein